MHGQLVAIEQLLTGSRKDTRHAQLVIAWLVCKLG